jgi:hypothetical protein
VLTKTRKVSRLVVILKYINASNVGNSDSQYQNLFSAPEALDNSRSLVLFGHNNYWDDCGALLVEAVEVP